MKRAIAYVSDIILGQTGDVIKRSCQVEVISQYAADNDIDIIGWFEDEMYNEDILSRPGIQALLACPKLCDTLLCERVWALSRSMAVLELFFRELDRRGVRLECATTMWDCVSQKCRHRFSAHTRERSPDPTPLIRHGDGERVRVTRPSHLHFEHLVK